MTIPRRTRPASRTSRLLLPLAMLITLVLPLSPLAQSSAQPSPEQSGPTATLTSKPTIVLVHGAFADASGWNGVVERLQHRGYTVYAPANPLRDLSGDSGYIRSFLDTITGPVVLVGHSYGGAVITNAATGDTNVKALVYIAAYALDEGETASEAGALGGGHTNLPKHIIVRSYVDGTDAYIDPAFFHRIFAADLPVQQTTIMAAEQRPADVAALNEPSGVPAWKTIPSWYLVASNDHAIPPEAERYMANRAGSHTVEIASSHVAMISHPSAVTRLILQAATS